MNSSDPSTTPQNSSTPRKTCRTPPLDLLDLLLIEEDFERLPKTEYTYAFSGSYSPRKLGSTYKKPNMSRPGIRKPYMFERSTLDYEDEIQMSEMDARLADQALLAPLTPLRESVNLNNSARNVREGSAASNISDRSTTRSGIEYGLQWKQERRRAQNRHNQTMGNPPVAQSVTKRVTRRSMPPMQQQQLHISHNDTTVNHLFGLDFDVSDTEHEKDNHSDSRYKSAGSGESQGWWSYIITVLVTIATTIGTAVTSATSHIASSSSRLVITVGSESQSFFSKACHWVWLLSCRICYGLFFVLYCLFYLLKHLVVKTARFVTAPLRGTTNWWYDLFLRKSGDSGNEHERSTHWLRSGKDRPDGEEDDTNADSSAESAETVTENQTKHTYAETVTVTTTVYEWLTWTVSLPMLAVKKPVEWYWWQMAGGEMEDDLPWLRSGKNRPHMIAKGRGRYRRNAAAAAGQMDVMTEDEEEDEEDYHEMEIVEDESTWVSEVLSFFNALMRFLLLIVTMPFLLVAGPFMWLWRKATGWRPEEEVTWLRSGRNRRLVGSKRKTRSRRTHDAMLSDDTEEEEDEADDEEEEIVTENKSYITKIIETITTTTWTVCYTASAPVRWVGRKLYSSKDTETEVSSSTDMVDAMYRNHRRASNSSESGYDTSDNADNNELDESTSVVTSLCGWLISFILWPFRLLVRWSYRKPSASAVEKEAEDDMDGADIISYQESASQRTSQLRYRKSRKKTQVTLPDSTGESEEPSSMSSIICNGLWYLLHLLTLPITAPYGWVKSAWNKLFSKEETYSDSKPKTLSSERVLTGEHRSYSEYVTSRTRSAFSWLLYIVALPFLLLAAPFIWTWNRTRSWSTSRQKTHRSQEGHHSVYESVSARTRAVGSWVWYLLTCPFLLLAAPFVWMYRKTDNWYSTRQSSQRTSETSFAESVSSRAGSVVGWLWWLLILPFLLLAESVSSTARRASGWLWWLLTLPFILLAAPFIWLYSKASSTSLRESVSKTTHSTGSWLWWLFTWPFLLLAAPVAWLWRKSKSWYINRSSDAVSNMVSSVRSGASSCSSWLMYLLALPFLLLAAPFLWLWRKVSASNPLGAAASAGSTVKTGVTYAATATGRGIMWVLSGTWWLLCLPFLLASQGIKKLRSSDNLKNITVFRDKSRREKGCGLGWCCLPLLLCLLLLPLYLYPGLLLFKESNSTSEIHTNSIIAPPAQVFIPVGGSDEDNKQMAELIAAIKKQREHINGMLAAMQNKDDAIMALQAEMAALQAGLRRGEEANQQATAGMAAALHEKIAHLQGEIDGQKALLAALMAQVKDCCRNDTALALWVAGIVKDEISGFFAGGGDANPALKAWVQDGFVSKEDHHARLATLAGTIEAQVLAQADRDREAIIAAASEAAAAAVVASATDAATAAATAAAVAAARTAASEAATLAVVQAADDAASRATADVAIIAAAAARAEVEAARSKDSGGASVAAGAAIMGSLAGAGLSEERVRALIKDALLLFAADRNNLPDYALESTGGSVISTRCSETYHRRTAQLSLFGIPLYYSYNSPRTVIQPDVHPGQCWPFKGNQGFVVIQLATLIKIDSFTLEHIPKSLSPNGNIDSAPRNFTVWGLENERDKEGTLLGSYIYEESGEPMQYFIVQHPNPPPFLYVELRVEDNWGNKEYTCLYRFRVHGKPV